jgi:RNA polymerase sigma factor (sigma-70 family)
MAEADSAELAAMATGSADGDQQAWNALIERYAPLVWSIARTHRLTEGEAADVSQIVWLRLLENVELLREPRRLPAWLATTARREAQRAARQRALTQELDSAEEYMDTRPTPDEVVETDERIASLYRALRQLSPRCQTILSLLLTEPPPSYAEMSAALNMSVGSIGPMRGRCLNHLRRLLIEGEGMSETELLAALRGSKLGAGDVPDRVIDTANDALAARLGSEASGDTSDQ